MGELRKGETMGVTSMSALGDAVKEAKCRYDHERYLTRRTALLASRQPDPVTLLSTEDLAYVAGIVDGEGTVYIAKKKTTMYPILAVGMTHRGVIEWLCQKLKTPKIWINNKTGIRKGTNWRPQWIFRLQGRRAQIAVAMMRPFLKVKAVHAALLDTYPIDARIAPGVKIAASEINLKREEIRLAIKKLNRRVRAAMGEGET
jgi:hypothetical protein